MANSFPEIVQIVWEEECEAFEDINVFAKNADIFKPNSADSEAAGQTHRVPCGINIESSTGLDVTGNQTDVIDATTPISLVDADIKNAYFQLNVKQSLVERRVRKSMQAATRKLGSDINTAIANEIRLKGALWSGETGPLTDYSDFAPAGSMLDEVGASMASDRYMYLPPRIKDGLANQLGMRATDNSRDHKAYQAGELPSIDDFMTFKCGPISQIAAESVTTVTVDGANQDSDIVAFDGTTQVAPNNDDPNRQVLTVANTSGSLTNGDIFSIAGVNRVNIDSKIDTGELMTFRVESGGGTTTPTIMPAIIASGPLQNVSAVPADTAVITAHNTVLATPALFTTQDAVRLFCSDLDWDALASSAGVTLDTYTTDSGIQLALIQQGSGLTGVVDYRMTAWCEPTVVQPLKCGGILPSQTTAF